VKGKGNIGKCGVCEGGAVALAGRGKGTVDREGAGKGGLSCEGGEFCLLKELREEGKGTAVADQGKHRGKLLLDESLVLKKDKQETEFGCVPSHVSLSKADG